MVQLDDLISGDGSSGSGSNTDLCTFVIVEQTGRLAVAVTGNKCDFLRIGHTANELLLEITFQVKGRVVQQFLGNFDQCGQLVRAQVLLCKGLGGLGDLTGLFYPVCSTVGSYNRDLVVGGCSGESVCQLTEYHLVSQSLYQGLFVSFGHQVAALTVNTLLQNIGNLVGYHTVLCTGSLPESTLIGIGSTAGLGVHLCSGGLFGDGGVHRLGHLSIHSFHTLHTADLCTQLGNGSFHAGVSGIILCGQAAILASTGLQESLCCFQSLCTLIAQLDNSH